MPKPEFLKALNALVLSVLLALWLGSECVARPASTAGSGSEISVLRIKGYDFPGAIAGMSRALVKEYEIPELGFTIRYESPDKAIWADIFVYDQKLDTSSAERAGDANNQLTLGVRAMKNAVARGRYKSASYGEVSREGPFATIHISAESDGRRMDIFDAVAVHKAKFIQLRISAPEGRNSTSLQTSFLNALSRQFGI
jgi:hypothetical protein